MYVNSFFGIEIELFVLCRIQKVIASRCTLHSDKGETADCLEARAALPWIFSFSFGVCGVTRFLTRGAQLFI